MELTGFLHLLTYLHFNSVMSRVMIFCALFSPSLIIHPLVGLSGVTVDDKAMSSGTSIKRVPFALCSLR